MREIKFRAWDITGKEMEELISLDLGSKPRARTVKGFLCDGEFVLMQYTGLKDKNGKEIYEGDIIGEESVYHFNERVSDGKVWEASSGNWARLEKKRKNFTGKEEENYISGYKLEVVEWKDKSCGFEPFSDSNDNCGHCGGGDNFKRYEIIGSIYENPELIIN